jgi:hypothetical protein
VLFNTLLLLSLLLLLLLLFYIKKGEIGRTCSTHLDLRKTNKVLVRKAERIRSPANTRLGRMMFRWTRNRARVLSHQ